jgi:histidyl-tRNA synthetase
MTNEAGQSALRAVKGMNDLLEDDLVQWRHLESVARETFLAYGFGEIRTPLVEELALYVRGVGESSDIVGKEMFLIADRQGGAPSMALRPEGTAGVVRALIEGGKIVADAYNKVFYLGPMFRNERPQAGRYRQFSQIGCETLGYAEPAADVEVIALVATLLERLGIKGAGVKLLLSSLGDGGADRARYNDALRAYFAKVEAQLSEDSKRRLAQNPLRILDSKDEGDQKLVVDAPKPLDFLSDDAKAHFAAVRAGLDALGIAYTVEPKLVRGLDYYTRTVFEFVAESGLGAQSTVAAGGRYDGLVEELGGRKTPAVGFAAGIERLLLVMKAAGSAAPITRIPLMLVSRDEDGRAMCRKLAYELRRRGVAVDVAVRDMSEKAQFKRVAKIDPLFTLAIGSGEIASGSAELKRRSDGAVSPIALDAAPIADALRAP